MPEDQRTYGIISVGAALGDDEYVQMHLQEKGDELCAEGDGIIDRIATGLASKSEQAANVASVLSLQERINYLAGTHMPSETKVLRQRVDLILSYLNNLITWIYNFKHEIKSDQHWAL